MRRFLVGRSYIVLAVTVVAWGASTMARSDELRFDSSTPETTNRTREAIMANASMAEQAEFMCAMIKVAYYDAPGISPGSADGGAVNQALAKAINGKTLGEFLDHARQFPAIPEGVAQMLGFANLSGVCGH